MQICDVDGMIRLAILATRDILPETEVTLDYQLLTNEAAEFTCECGSSICRGTLANASPASPSQSSLSEEQSSHHHHHNNNPKIFKQKASPCVAMKRYKRRYVEISDRLRPAIINVCDCQEGFELIVNTHPDTDDEEASMGGGKSSRNDSCTGISRGHDWKEQSHTEQEAPASSEQEFPASPDSGDVHSDASIFSLQVKLDGSLTEDEISRLCVLPKPLLWNLMKETMAALGSTNPYLPQAPQVVTGEKAPSTELEVLHASQLSPRARTGVGQSKRSHVRKVGKDMKTEGRKKTTKWTREEFEVVKAAVNQNLGLQKIVDLVKTRSESAVGKVFYKYRQQLDTKHQTDTQTETQVEAQTETQAEAQTEINTLAPIETTAKKEEPDDQHVQHAVPSSAGGPESKTAKATGKWSVEETHLLEQAIEQNLTLSEMTDLIKTRSRSAVSSRLIRTRELSAGLASKPKVQVNKRTNMAPQSKRRRLSAKI